MSEGRAISGRLRGALSSALNFLSVALKFLSNLLEKDGKYDAAARCEQRRPGRCSPLACASAWARGVAAHQTATLFRKLLAVFAGPGSEVRSRLLTRTTPGALMRMAGLLALKWRTTLST